MDIGEVAITLTDEERTAMQYNPVDGFDAEWPTSNAMALEWLMSDRILDKQNIVEEVKQRGELARYAAKLFEVRAQIAVLEAADDQLREFCYDSLPGANPPGQAPN